MKFSREQWKLIFDSVRKQQVNQIVGSRWYQEYDTILNAMYEEAHQEKKVRTYDHLAFGDYDGASEEDK
tara:strand:- start:65 stop:271 length:207 start_codon:yes stop_codon:yes gene_type:complete